MSRIRPIFALLAMLLLSLSGAASEPVSVLKYLPANPQLDGSVDYRAEIQRAVNENKVLEFPGSGDPARPHVYGIRPADNQRLKRPCGLDVPAGHTLIGSGSAVLKRLPNRGYLIVTGKGVTVRSLIVDGNKAAHFPEFPELGKSDMGICFGAENLIEDCYVYNIPGIAFGTYSDRSLVRRCKARNAGYIDVKFKADYYQGKWDKYSGDSFYIRGRDNVVADCDSEDASRWDYTTCHERSGGTLYLNCNGRDVTFRSYGFIDIEGCDGAGSILVNCKSPDGSLAVSTSGTQLYNCTAQRINAYAADDVVIANCETFGGGLCVGGWSSAKKSYIRGGNRPIVVNNIVNRDAPGAGVPETSDWSLSVFSADGGGLAAGNVLHEYRGPKGRGPGLKFDKVPHYGNVLDYGQYKIPDRPEPDADARALQKAQADVRLREFAVKIPELAEKLQVPGKIVVTTLTAAEGDFIKDETDAGVKGEWFKPGKKPAGTRKIDIGRHWDNQIGGYSGHAWYFIALPLDQDDRHICDTVNLLFGGVDTEARVWLNGEFIGQSDDWANPFALKVPFKLLKWEDEAEPNLLAVRVSSKAGLGGVYGYIAAVLTKTTEGK